MAMNDNNDGAGYPLFTFVDENIFKKETFLGKCQKGIISLHALMFSCSCGMRLLLLHNRSVKKCLN